MRKIYVNKKENIIELGMLENNSLVEYCTINSEEKHTLEGNIYIGMVRNIVQGMQSFFIDIGQKKNGLLFFNDVGEKEDGQYVKDNNPDKISTLLKNGKNVIVQIKKDAVNEKGPKLTTDISLTGRYFILTPHSHFVTISKKIDDEELKQKYMELVKKYLPENYGGIIRTNISEATEDDIKEEIDTLIAKWKKVKKFEDNINEYTEPTLIYEEEDTLTRNIQDVVNSDLEEICVNDKELMNRVTEIVRMSNKKYLDKIKLLEYDDLLKMYGLREKMDKDMKNKVWLRSGAYLIINDTEALTAIDVNTGKYIGKSNLENTVFAVNKEAVVEIARQMRLRNIGGIIVIDFIDMASEEHKEEIMKLLKEQVKKDRSKIDVKGYTRLNLMEITRKKKK